MSITGQTIKAQSIYICIMILRYLYLVCFIFLVVQSTTFAQACCSGGTPLSSNLGIQPLEEKLLQFQLSYDYNTQRDLILGDRQLEDDSRHRDTHSLLLRTSYAFAPRWSITGLFSLVRQEEDIFRSTGNFTTASQGIGDLVGLLQYALVSKTNTNLILAGGAKIPIGVTDRIDQRTGIELNPDLQPGTGAWDGIFGLHFAQNHFLKQNLSIFFTNTYRLTSKDDRFDGRQTYKFGNEWISQLGFKDRFLIGGLIVDPSIVFKYRNTLRDEVDQSLVPNTSGHWVHLLPGIDLAFHPDFAIGASFELPIYRNLFGTQLTTTRKITLSLNYTLRSNQTVIN